MSVKLRSHATAGVLATVVLVTTAMLAGCPAQKKSVETTPQEASPPAAQQDQAAAVEPAPAKESESPKFALAKKDAKRQAVEAAPTQEKPAQPEAEPQSDCHSKAPDPKPDQSVEAAQQPSWACEKTTVENLSVWQGQQAEFTFVIRNEGTADLQIKAKGG